MNTLTVHISKKPLSCFRFIFDFQRITNKYGTFLSAPYHATTVDAIDVFTIELLQRHRNKMRSRLLDVNISTIRYFMDLDKDAQKDVSQMTLEELDKILLEFMTNNKDRKIRNVINECYNFNKTISDITLKKLFRNYSIAGKPDIVEILMKYCLKVNPCVYKHNGGFFHFLAKAQCMKGNSEKGLLILTDCYKNNEGLRSLYRIIFRELIQDSVLNRSEASLMIFKKYVLEFSEQLQEHYPLVCFWHVCWSSSWFSDQMLSNDLLQSSASLQGIVRDKAMAFSITILRQEYNEDAVLRLLQTLLKYKMMQEYGKVLEVLFAYKLKNRDLRGCSEIIRNCRVLGISLPSNQQGRYIKMLIDGKQSDGQEVATKSTTKNFKLKF